MKVPDDLLAYLHESEECDSLSSLRELDEKESWDLIIKRLNRQPVSKYAKFAALTQGCLWKASQYAKYLYDLGIPAEVKLFGYKTHIQPFASQFSTILERKKDSELTILLFKNYQKDKLGFIDDFKKVLREVTCAADALLTYVVRPIIKPGSSPVLLANFPCEDKNQSIESMLESYKSHANHHWADDNAKFWQLFHSASIGTNLLPILDSCNEDGVKNERKAWDTFEAVHCNPEV